LAGSENGFIPGALLIKSSTTASEDYHKEMDGFGFENWFRQSLLPNIPNDSIIVMDNASYHSLSNIPKSIDKVGVMKQWLLEKKIPFPVKAVKKEIWAIIKEQKGKTQHYLIDRLAQEFGHEILRLPPYHCDLNPIELVWAHVKQYVAKNNCTGQVNDVLNLAQMYMEAYPPETWAANIRH
jgi:transposase